MQSSMQQNVCVIDLTGKHSSQLHYLLSLLSTLPVRNSKPIRLQHDRQIWRFPNFIAIVVVFFQFELAVTTICFFKKHILFLIS